MSTVRVNLWAYGEMKKIHSNIESTLTEFVSKNNPFFLVKKNGLEKILSDKIEDHINKNYVETDKDIITLSYLLEKNKKLDPINQGLVRKITVDKIHALLNKSYTEDQKKEIMLSAAMFGVHGEFNAFERIKNSLDAESTYVSAIVNIDEKTVTVTVFDNGKGFQELHKDLKDEEGALNYLKVVDPTFADTKLEGEASGFNRASLHKITSLKTITLGKEQKQTGGKGEGLKADAILMHSAGGKFLLLNMEDFVKSEKYKTLSGISSADIATLPTRGAVFIYQSPKYSENFVEEYKAKNIKYIKKNGTPEFNYFYSINPSFKVEEINNIYIPRTHIQLDESNDPLSPDAQERLSLLRDKTSGLSSMTSPTAPETPFSTPHSGETTGSSFSVSVPESQSFSSSGFSLFIDVGSPTRSESPTSARTVSPNDSVYKDITPPTSQQKKVG